MSSTHRDPSPLRLALEHEILMARQRIYGVRGPTPLESIPFDDGTEVFYKMENIAPMYAYKWRGACNRMALLTEDERQRGVVTASAGNHAQGVAIAAAALNTRARIFMPVATPKMKQIAVRKHGGDAVEITLIGDSFDAAATAAWAYAKEQGVPMIHPYDDLAVMGGQGTIADEVVMSGKGPFDCALLQIGGGGMAAGVACWLRKYYPDIRIIGVEGVDQASMGSAVQAGEPVTLDYLDVFCDGTAVRRAGELTYPLCAELIDEFITVTNAEVCAGIQFLWEQGRIITEPAGALGIAAWIKMREELKGQKILTVLCGSNMDFAQFSRVVRQASVGSAVRRFFRIEVEERNGTLHDLLKSVRSVANIVEFQYGKTDASRAWPVIGFEAAPDALAEITAAWDQAGVSYDDVTNQQDVDFRVIQYVATLFRHPWFVEIEFPERAGALSDFLGAVHAYAGICYFNYSYSGERVGRALLGFEFDSPDDQDRLRQHIFVDGDHGLRAVREVPDAVLERMI